MLTFSPVAPIILEGPQDKNVTYLKESIRLYCTVSGFPVPEVSWRFGADVYLNASSERVNISSISNSPFGEDTVVLEISMARLSETGYYTCVASSPYFDSVESVPALITVQGKSVHYSPCILLKICMLLKENHEFAGLTFTALQLVIDYV